MGEEDEREASFPALLKLPYLHIANMDSPEHPTGMATPPLQTSASVPFKWEEQPGKPRPCSDLIPLPEPAKALELPPCRNRIPSTDPGDKFTKTPSPTTVLDGPYNVGRPKFSSFRFFRYREEKLYDPVVGLSSASPEEGCPGSESLLGGKKSGGGVKARGIFGKFKAGRKEVYSGSCRFSPSSVSSCESYESCTGVKNGGGGVKMRRNGSFSSISHATSSHLWATICGGIKQVIQWKSGSKSNKEGRD